MPGRNALQNLLLYQMLLEKLPDLTLLDNECLKFWKPMLSEHICHNFSGRPTSAPEVPYYSIEHAGVCSTSHCFAQLRGEMPGKAAGDSRRSAEIIRKSIFRHHKICHFFDPQKSHFRIKFQLISKLPCIELHCKTFFDIKCSWKNYQISPC